MLKPVAKILKTILVVVIQINKVGRGSLKLKTPPIFIYSSKLGFGDKCKMQNAK